MIMNRRVLSTVGFASAATFLLVSTGVAGKAKFNRVVNVGDTGPVWTEVVGVDGKKHSLADHKKAKLVVVAFICNHCPMSKAYEKRLVQFTNDYRKKGVEVVGISVSQFPADRLEKMKIRAKKSGFNFPYLFDPSQKIGRAYGATCTPHVFVLDKKRTIAYMGAIDDNFHPGKAKRHYLRDAVDALLAGDKPEVVEMRQTGCEIDYILE